MNEIDRLERELAEAKKALAEAVNRAEQAEAVLAHTNERLKETVGFYGLQKARADALRSSVGALVEAANEVVTRLEYYVNNPSGWEHYDDQMSERIGVVVEAARAALSQAQENAK